MTIPDFQSTEAMRIALSQGGTIPNAVLYGNGQDLANAITASGATIPGAPTGTAGGMLSGTYPNPNVASISGLVAGGGLTGTYPNPTLAPNSVSSSNIVDGSIGIDDLGTSARAWGAYVMYNTWGTGQYQQTTASFTVPTRSTCIFTMSSSAYVLAVSTYAFFYAIDGVTGWSEWTRYFHNNTSDHRTYPTGFGNVNLNAGTYTLRLLSASGQYTDYNDRAIAAVAGYPY